MSGGETMSGSVTRTVDLPAGAGEVWSVVGDFDGLPRWNAGIEKSVLSEGGRRRTLTLKIGATVVEDLLGRDDAARSISYSIVESAVPVSRHRATIAVLDRGANQCTVRWSCEFEPSGAPVDTVAGIFAGIFERGLKELANLFGGGSPRA